MDYLNALFEAHRPYSPFIGVAIGVALGRFILTPIVNRIAGN